MAQNKKEIRNINGVDKLQCSKCKYWLPLDDFGFSKSTSTGKRSYCKVCQKSHYDSKRKQNISNTGIIGLFRYECPVCKTTFTTKNARKIFCSKKCNCRDWYERNEQTATAKKFGRSRNHLNIKRINKSNEK